MNTAVIGMGSNIEAGRNIEAARDMISRRLGVLGTSEFVRTEPVGFSDQDDFLNGSVLVETRLDLEELRVFLKEVEKTLGRETRENRHGPREIDLDILVWNGEVVDPDVYEREFLRNSIMELCPKLEVALRGGKKS